jgi:putative endonuclease
MYNIVMTSPKTKTGNLGEDAAVKYLTQKSYRVIERNYQNNSGRRLGEIDIVAMDEKTGELVFVEVKTRLGKMYLETLPEENITSGKLRRLAKIGSAYLRHRRIFDFPYRFDAISVWLDSDGKEVKIKHIESL